MVCEAPEGSVLTCRWSGPWNIVGRVWPRHGRRGRPLNSVVRCTRYWNRCVVASWATCRTWRHVVSQPSIRNICYTNQLCVSRTAKGYRVECEFPLLHLHTGRGDWKRIDFDMRKNTKRFGIEVKWIKSNSPDLTADLDKLAWYSFQFDAPGFMLLFGASKYFKNLRPKSEATEKSRGRVAVWMRGGPNMQPNGYSTSNNALERPEGHVGRVCPRHSGRWSAAQLVVRQHLKAPWRKRAAAPQTADRGSAAGEVPTLFAVARVHAVGAFCSERQAWRHHHVLDLIELGGWAALLVSALPASASRIRTRNSDKDGAKARVRKHHHRIQAPSTGSKTRRMFGSSRPIQTNPLLTSSRIAKTLSKFSALLSSEWKSTPVSNIKRTAGASLLA